MANSYTVNDNQGMPRIPQGFSTEEAIVLAVLLVLGLAGAFFGYPLLDHYPHYFGKHLGGLFLPPLLSILYVTYAGIRRGLNRSVLYKTGALFVLLCVPYAPLFFQAARPFEHDDFGRYYLYAQNMIEHHTLWGGDQLVFTHAGYHYVTQPGYRYWVAAELWLFGDLYRFVQVLNLGLYVVAVYCFQRTICQVVEHRKWQIALLLLVLLVSPYFVKNVLMGLPEWLAMALLMGSCYCYAVPRYRVAAVVLLALVPFFRQNLLFSVLLLFGCMLVMNKKKAVMLIAFTLPLLLPVYHNLYYAHEWRFFGDVMITLPPGISSSAMGFNYALVAQKLLHYTGFLYEGNKWQFSPLAAAFAPLSVVLFFLLLSILRPFRCQLLFVVTTLCAVVPTLVFGYAYFPRFEAVNAVVMMAAFLLLYVHRSRAMPEA